MRKFIFSVMAVAAITFSSCANKTDKAEGADSAQVEVADSAADVAAVVETPEGAVEKMKASLESGDAETVTATIEAAKQKMAQLVNEGKEDELKAYAQKIKDFVTENQETLKATGNETLNKVLSGVESLNVDNIVDTAKGWAANVGDAATAVKNEAEGAVANGEAAVEQGKEDLKAKGNEAVEEAKAAANQKVEDAKEAANKKVEEGVKKAEDAAKEEVNKGIGNAKKALGL
ncbi:MAG: hypothetical protein HUK08_09510 [Bacteroidaceae bacterium]|nr:hypothetical protein [Bacteroidaceae bacterium]